MPRDRVQSGLYRSGAPAFRVASAGGNRIADVVRMSSPTLNLERQAERLWTAADGTTCILATCDTPPTYSVSLIRDAQVLRERRLYGLASAQMLAQGWKEVGLAAPR
jgi:hypothetical protein